MALGGGTFITQNKLIPGTYINFVSAEKASSIFADRGYCAFALPLKWGASDGVITLTKSDLINDSQKLFGYPYDAEDLRPLRDIFLNAATLYLYRLGGGNKAACALGTAKYAGSRGNALSIQTYGLTDGGYNVKILFDNSIVFEENITSANLSELPPNDYIDFSSSATISSASAQTVKLQGGSDTSPVGNDHQKALSAFESYAFNVLGCDSTDDTVKALYAAYTKRMRDEVGVKFQTVLYNYTQPDYEGIISVKNSVDAVYWVTGAEAGCAVNRSLTNSKYNGEYDIPTNYTQSQLEAALKSGEFVLHKVNDEIRVLDDINSFVSFSKDKNEDFSANQTIRVLDQIAMDIAAIFNTYYLGKVPNDNAGRISLWNDIVKHHKTLQDLRAIEDFKSEDVTVLKGNTKKSVVVTDRVTVTNAMTQLYMTVIVA